MNMIFKTGCVERSSSDFKDTVFKPCNHSFKQMDVYIDFLSNTSLMFLGEPEFAPSYLFSSSIFVGMLKSMSFYCKFSSFSGTTMSENRYGTMEFAR